jgi:hypothetical protein
MATLPLATLDGSNEPTAAAFLSTLDGSKEPTAAAAAVAAATAAAAAAVAAAEWAASPHRLADPSVAVGSSEPMATLPLRDARRLERARSSNRRMGCQPAPAGGSLSGRRPSEPTATPPLATLDGSKELATAALLATLDVARKSQQQQPQNGLPARTGWRIPQWPSAERAHGHPTARNARRLERASDSSTSRDARCGS